MSFLILNNFDLSVFIIAMLSFIVGAALVFFMQFIRKRKSLGIKSELHLHDTARIKKIEQDLITSSDFKEALTNLYQNLSDIFHVDSFYVSFYDQEEDSLFFPIFVNENIITVYPFREMMRVSKKMGAGYTSYILKSKQTLFVPDTFDPPSGLPVPTHLGGNPTRSFIGVPLYLGGEVIGVLSIQSNSPHQYAPAAIKFMEKIATPVAYMVDNMRLVEGLSQYLIELETLRSGAAAIASSLKLDEIIEIILDELYKIVPNDCAMVVWLHEEERELLAVRGQQHCDLTGKLILNEDENLVVDKVIESQSIRYKNDSSYEARSHQPDKKMGTASALMGIPLMVKDVLLGVLVVEKKYINDKTWGFTKHHVQLANAMADQVAIALKNSMLYEEANQLAITDHLMDIFNRRHFFALAENKLLNCLKKNQPLSLIMLDIDHFKEVNDTHGHLIGDHVLRQIAFLCSQNIREGDLIGRFGGEEIVILFSKIGPQQALKKAEALKDLLADTEIQTEKGLIRVTASLGVAGIDVDNQNEATIESLLNQADQALYQSKGAGRNQVSVYEANKS